MTWLYRLVIFFGIAVAVYLFFFKILGIFLFAVELAWFIALPVWRELKVWWARRAEVPCKRRRQLVLAGMAFLLLLAIPWKTQVSGVGLAHASRQTRVYAPYAAQLNSLRQIGAVDAGALLVQLDAPDIRAQGERNQARAQGLASQLTGLQAQERGVEQTAETAGRLGEQLAELQAAGEELGRLTLRAEYAGLWLDVDPQKQSGTWINPREALGILIDPLLWQVDAYVGQSDVERFAAGAEVIFYPEHRLQGLRGKVIDVDTAEASRISEPMLTTRHGGAIPLAAQTQELIPAEPHFRVRIALESAPESLRETRGKVVIEGHWRSPLGDLLTALIAVLFRESGF